jgi:2-hydroxychromene-2-carboxylate isomerase
MSDPGAAFYFDLSGPLDYLVAEQIPPALAEWQPVLARALPGAASRAAFRRKRVAQSAEGRRAGPLFFGQTEDDSVLEEIERRASDLGLQPLRPPADYPFDSEFAMRVATYAKSIGRTVPFARAAFRQAFAGGRSLADVDNVLIAAAACEMHPAAVLKAAELASVRERLATATAEAAELGVADVPAVRIGGRIFTGTDALDRAIAA